MNILPYYVLVPNCAADRKIQGLLLVASCVAPQVRAGRPARMRGLLGDDSAAESPACQSARARPPNPHRLPSYSRVARST